MKVTTLPYDGEITDEQKKNILFWLENLRSGKFNQGKNFLLNIGCYCCLGVACEINNVPKESPDGNSITRFKFPNGKIDKGLPDGDWMKEKFGFLPDIHIIQAVRGADNMLVLNIPSLNDGGVTFAEIADIIEAAILNREVKEIETSIPQTSIPS